MGADRDLYIWIYQRTRAKVPWAIRVHGIRRGRTVYYDAELYAEWIPNKAERIIMRGCRFWLLPLVETDDAPIRKCVLTGLPGMVRDICELYGGEVGQVDLALIRQKMQSFYKKLR